MENTIQKAKELFECETARIESYGGTLFLIIGEMRNTKNDPGVWINENGERQDWEYLHEVCIASGRNVEELEKDMIYYKRVSEMT
jgi:hypothetical protein